MNKRLTLGPFPEAMHVTHLIVQQDGKKWRVPIGANGSVPALNDTLTIDELPPVVEPADEETQSKAEVRAAVNARIDAYRATIVSSYKSTLSNVARDAVDSLCQFARRLFAEREIARDIVKKHDLCHNLNGKVDARAFADGCAQEQRKLYGCAPDADELARARADANAVAVRELRAVEERIVRVRPSSYKLNAAAAHDIDLFTVRERIAALQAEQPTAPVPQPQKPVVESQPNPGVVKVDRHEFSVADGVKFTAEDVLKRLGKSSADYGVWCKAIDKFGDMLLDPWDEVSRHHVYFTAPKIINNSATQPQKPEATREVLERLRAMPARLVFDAQSEPSGQWVHLDSVQLVIDEELAKLDKSAPLQADAAGTAVLDEIREERRKQDAKWGQQNHEFPVWLAILQEEIGEASHEFLHAHFESTEKATEHAAKLHVELVQSAAVLAAIIECGHRNSWWPVVQAIGSLDDRVRRLEAR